MSNKRENFRNSTNYREFLRYLMGNKIVEDLKKAEEEGLIEPEEEIGKLRI